MIALWTAALVGAQAGDVETTRAYAANTVAHGMVMGAAAAAIATNEPGWLVPAAFGTHVALFTTPAMLHADEPWLAVDSWQRSWSWGLYATGVGITAIGWTLVFAEPELGAAVMVLGDLALIGASTLLASAYLGEEAGWTVPVVSGRF